MSTSARRGVPPMTPLQSFPDHYPSHAGPSVLDYTTDVSPIRQEGGDFFYSYRIPATDARPAPYGVQRDTYLSKCAAIAPWSVEYDLEIQRPQTPIVGATYGICRVEDPRLAQQPVKQSATQAAEQPAKPKMDMNMARPGSDSSMAGHQTHIARHVGTSLCLLDSACLTSSCTRCLVLAHSYTPLSSDITINQRQRSCRVYTRH